MNNNLVKAKPPIQFATQDELLRRIELEYVTSNPAPTAVVTELTPILEDGIFETMSALESSDDQVEHNEDEEKKLKYWVSEP